MKRFMLSVAALAAAVTIMAQSQSVVSYASPDADCDPSGTGKTETYDVAIALTQSDLAGKSIVRVEIPVIPSPNVSGLSIWVTTQPKLELINGKNTNIVDKRWDLQMPSEGEMQFLTLDLDEPYVIPEGGLYVGYSMTIDRIDNTDGTQTPIVTALTSKEGGFWLHTSRSYLNWKDRSTELGVVAMTQVTVEGDIEENAAAIGEIPFSYIAIGSPQNIMIPVQNIGQKPVQTLTYTTSIGDTTFDGEITLDTPIPNVFGYTENLPFTLPAVGVLGEYDADVSITSVNGEACLRSAVAHVEALTFVPKHLALVEEFTGTWCGWCPRGFVAMEKMNEFYPDFTGIAYHDNDPMAMAGGYPEYTSGFPQVGIDRVIKTDPYEADPLVSGFTLPAVWESRCAEFTPVGIFIDASCSADSILTVNSRVEWVKPAVEGSYRLEYVVVANDLHGQGASWRQNNYYSGGVPELYMDFFCSAPKKVDGLHFNDVAIMTSGFYGVEGSITSTEVGYSNQHTQTFDLRGIKNFADMPFDFDIEKLRVVAFVLKTDGGYGTAVNAVRCDVDASAAGVGNVGLDANQTAPVYYNLQGRRVDNPSAGQILIRVAGGKASKILFR